MSDVPFSSHESLHQPSKMGNGVPPEFEQNKIHLQRHIRHQIKRTKKKIDSLEYSLKECLSAAHVLHEGNLLKANFSLLKKGISSITVWDWESEVDCTVNLDPKKNPQEQLASRFKRAKKLQRGTPHLEKQIAIGKAELAKWEKQLADCESLTNLEEVEALQNFLFPPLDSAKKASQNEAKKLPYREFVSSAGSKIWVGKNAKGNDRLTFTHANGSDWWMHVRGYPGSHIVIKVLKGMEPDSETIADATQLALYFSKARECGEGEVCLTQRKFVSRFGKQPGKVQISKHETRYVKIDLERYSALKRRGQAS